MDVRYFEVSAQDNIGINELFKEIAMRTLDKNK